MSIFGFTKQWDSPLYIKFRLSSHKGSTVNDYDMQLWPYSYQQNHRKKYYGRDTLECDMDKPKWRFKLFQRALWGFKETAKSLTISVMG